MHYAIRTDLRCIVRDNGDTTTSSIPFNLENRDCLTFIADWKTGATVTNADGSPAPYSDAALADLSFQ